MQIIKVIIKQSRSNAQSSIKPKKARITKDNKEKETTKLLAHQKIENEELLQELDKENLDLVMEYDDWATNPTSLLSPDINNKSHAKK